MQINKMSIKYLHGVHSLKRIEKIIVNENLTTKGNENIILSIRINY